MPIARKPARGRRRVIAPDEASAPVTTEPPAPDQALPAATAKFRLADLGIYGFDRHQVTILAALVTEDPLLLVGRSGTGKTFMLNTLSEALGLEHRHYNASLISFDDLVGFPYPDEAHSTVRFLETPATVWGAESVLNVVRNPKLDPQPVRHRIS